MSAIPQENSETSVLTTSVTMPDSELRSRKQLWNGALLSATARLSPNLILKKIFIRYSSAMKLCGDQGEKILPKNHKIEKMQFLLE